MQKSPGSRRLFNQCGSCEIVIDWEGEVLSFDQLAEKNASPGTIKVVVFARSDDEFEELQALMAGDSFDGRSIGVTVVKKMASSPKFRERQGKLAPRMAHVVPLGKSQTEKTDTHS